MRKIDKVIIHYSATRPYQDIGVDEIDSWHRQRGWNGIGYHFVIRKNGKIEYGRQIGDMGAHAKGSNRNSIGICWIGGLDMHGKSIDDRTDKQEESIVSLLTSLWVVLKDDFQILGHNNVRNTDCPGFDAKSEYEIYNKDIT